ncbi:MAG: hypothetical protein GC168_12390 [Candidatus Hydrogenedens sp.]|nr:hypothetical protein [Candidatus Hydrogenedens sp.]
MKQIWDERAADTDDHSPDGDDLLIQGLRQIIRLSVRVLAILMTLVIVWGVIDVGWVLYQRLVTPPMFLLEIDDILATFGAFMAVLIAIEIFVNITIYLRDDIIHVKIVMATALMAIARKVIILDVKETDVMMVFAIAAVIFSLSIGYWLLNLKVIQLRPRPMAPAQARPAQAAPAQRPAAARHEA